MKRSEAIETFRKTISEELINRYRSVLECDGRIQYKVYVWEDGEIECLSGPQGDNSWLQAKDTEPRELFYVCKVDSPFFDPWDCADHSAPDDEEEREKERAEIIEWLVDQYAEQLDAIIEEEQ